jgi:serine/threonine-protein kinase SRPK3
LKTIKELKGIHKLPRLFDNFETEGPHGQHLCLVTPVLSTDVSSFRRSAPSKRLGSSTVKIIIVQVVECLKTLHTAQIIHTGECTRHSGNNVIIFPFITLCRCQAGQRALH